MSYFKIYSDGASRGNPGNAGAGAIIFDSAGNTIATVSKYLGTTTNNQAEYIALLLALEKIATLKPTAVEIFADSELMIKQLKGEYKVKNILLKPHYEKIMKILSTIDSYSLKHIPREKNKEADKLANLAIDNKIS
jgi:ribonuclease HI